LLRCMSLELAQSGEGQRSRMSGAGESRRRLQHAAHVLHS
jgi:hypothetical protein